MAIILMSWGNKEKKICYPIQKKSSSRLLKNQEESNTTNSGKTLQIISQNDTHTSMVMPCDSSVINKEGDIFSIKNPYILNCNESRVFSYIDKVTLWINGICAVTKKYLDFPSHIPVQNYSTIITHFFYSTVTNCQKYSIFSMKLSKIFHFFYENEKVKIRVVVFVGNEIKLNLNVEFTTPMMIRFGCDSWI
jgi:hypothetical protein